MIYILSCNLYYAKKEQGKTFNFPNCLIIYFGVYLILEIYLRGDLQMKKFMGEFKKFISRGNVLDMAVGIIIGGAFTSIVQSLVNDIINPLLGIFGGKDLSSLVIDLPGEATLNYGNFIAAIINFLIMAFIVFSIVKLMNGISAKMAPKKEEAPKAPTTKVCPFCKTEIAIEATRCPHCTSMLED